jgi:hypothetical protein
MNRRDLLQLFGVGATIVPIIGSEVVEEAKATLIEVPKVELVKQLPPALQQKFSPDSWIAVGDISFSWHNPATGKKFEFVAQKGKLTMHLITVREGHALIDKYVEFTLKGTTLATGETGKVADFIEYWT